MKTVVCHTRGRKAASGGLCLFFLSLVLFTGLSAQDQSPGAGRDQSGGAGIPAGSGTVELAALVTAALEPAAARRIIVPGENLQTIADAAYGSRLVWPLVWWVNKDSIPDPERIGAGLDLQVPRLRAGFADMGTRRALEAAYVLVYGCYRQQPGHSAGQRQWVLVQAGNSGIDWRSPAWAGVLDPVDVAWAERKVRLGPPLADKVSLSPAVSGAEGPATTVSPDAPASNANPAGEQPDPRFASPGSQQGFLTEILAGTPLPIADMEAWAGAVEQSGKLAEVQQTLETSAGRPDAPPQVVFALSLTYRRLGLLQKEYAALQQTCEVAKRRPEVVFNLILVTGRLKLLESTVRLEDLLPATPVAVATNASEPPQVEPVPEPAAMPAKGTFKVSSRRDRSDVRLDGVVVGYVMPGEELLVDALPGVVHVMSINPAGTLGRTEALEVQVDAGQTVPVVFGLESETPVGGKAQTDDSTRLDLRRSALGEWLFDGGTRDSLGKNAGLKGTPMFGQDRFGREKMAMSCKTSKVRTLELPLEKLNYDTFSFSFWVKLDSKVKHDYPKFLYAMDYAGKKGFSVEYSSGAKRIVFAWFGRDGEYNEYGGPTNAVWMGFEPKMDVWYHIVVCYNYGEGEMYVNAIRQGNFIGSEILPHKEAIKLGGLYMQAYSQANTAVQSLTGGIDDLRVYNRRLEPGDVYRLYKETADHVID